MRWLRVVARVAVVWLMSLAVAAAGLELARRFTLATEGGTAVRAAAVKAGPVHASTDVRF
jgi:hypothetical protein